MTKQPIMIRTIVVCPVTGCYRVVWQPLNEAIQPDRIGSPSASFLPRPSYWDVAATMTASLFSIKSRVPGLNHPVIDLHAVKPDIAQPSPVLVFRVFECLDPDN